MSIPSPVRVESFPSSAVLVHPASVPRLLQAIPLARPNAPRLSAIPESLAAIENSHRLSNYGPVNHQFEQAMLDQVFRGSGHCVTVCNATMGLILALKQAASRQRAGSFVLMPSFTFAAAAHAVLWAGLTPLLIDVDEDDWAACKHGERRMLERHGSNIAAIMPYATFGSMIDLARYDRLSEDFGVPVVVDAAASLGSLGEDGIAFGSGSQHTIVFSMHATKAFAVGECGLVYSANEAIVETVRCMGNFGFDGSRSAAMPGLNSKISEVVAMSGLVKLRDYETHAWHRMHLAEVYRSTLASCQLQEVRGLRVAYQFMPVLLPKGMAQHRDAIVESATSRGIGIGKYFSPHIYQQPYFKNVCLADRLPNTDDIASRILSLPISDFMTVEDAYSVASFLEEQIAELQCDAC